MNIDGGLGGLASQKTGAMGAFARAMDRFGVTYDKTGLPLTRSDVEVLKAASGLDFSWPPKAGQLVPEGAFELGALREKQLRGHMPLKDLTVDDLKLMVAKGLLPEETGLRAQAYLTDGKRVAANEARPTTPATPATPSSSTAKVTYGFSGENGDLYL